MNPQDARDLAMGPLPHVFGEDWIDVMALLFHTWVQTLV